MTLALNRFFSRSSRFFDTVGLLLALGAAPGCSSSPDSSEAPPAAVVPERAVEVVEAGAGGTTVVFESGLGNDWTPWQEVATEVAAHARTFAYSRPGYGKSEASPDPRDAAQIVADLRSLLSARSIQPPYVLVGHSFGGAYMELFAKSHPGEVAGLVLVDPRHRDFTSACTAAALEGCAVPDAIVAMLPKVERDELEAFAQASGQIDAAGGFGKYPVRVLTGTTHGFVPEVETLWQSMHGSLAKEAVDGEQTVFTGAGHYLQLERPHEVAEVVISLIPSQ